MARWDEILSLPVQNPPTLEFSSDDLVWSKVEGWRDNIDRVSLIPFARVDDFLRGESSNKDCPTRFHVEARRRRPPEMPYKPKVDGILEYILYWCSFGPDDHRKGGIVRPSRSTYVPKKKSAGRPNTKRGCTCHFIVKRLIAEPSVALIIYNQDKHIDKKGLPCHGPQDKKAAGTRAMYAPYISEDLRLRVLSLLYVGVSVETIMQRHNESVEKQGGPCNRDDLLTHRYVRRQERSIRRSTYELDSDDAVSISMWVESHQSHVFFYEDFSDCDPFVLGIQTEWQLQQMIRFGNRSLMASDSRFGTNKLKYPIHSLVVFNSDNKAIPVAWIIAPRFASGDSHRWMRALYNRVCTKDPTWKLAGFIVDDPLADVFTISGVKFSAEEERIVIELQAEFGNKWARIATYLPGRTDNDVKNFWSSRQKRLARILQTPSTPLKTQKNIQAVAVLHDVPSLQAPKFSSSMEEESSSKSHSCSSSYIDDSEMIKMVPLPDLVNPDFFNFEQNLLQPEFITAEKNLCNELQSQVPFTMIPPLQSSTPLLLESQKLIARFGDTDFLNAYAFGQPSDSELCNGTHLPFVQPYFGSEGCSQSGGKGDNGNPLTPDSFFDDFPTDMFDHIEPLPSPSGW